ncbi:MAG: hypothetical protein KatS3mg113_0460 [Planctomycetaceae bacterium]|nr:MAG: hypothetical protein KatS3mg113_0460 [Planctomycetaceae bacterium]
MRRLRISRWAWLEDPTRRGIIMVVGAFCLIVCLSLVAISIDTGMISLAKTQLRSATDAAALAAAMEINHAIANAGTDVVDVFAYAKLQARQKAAEVAALNGVYVDPVQDVEFGYRHLVGSTPVIDWNSGATQINTVKVRARRDNVDPSAPNARIPALFSSVFGNQGNVVESESIAYIEPRDLVVVHDFSRSMNFDSYFSDEVGISLPQAQLEANINLVWQDLQPLVLGTMPYAPVYLSQTKSNTGASATVTFKGRQVSITTNTNIKTVVIYFETGSSQTFNISNETTKSGTWQGTGSHSNKRINKVDVTIRRVGSSSQNWTLSNYLYDVNLLTSSFLLTVYPFPGGSWSEYFNFVKTNGGLSMYGYQDRFGAMTFVCYLLRQRPSFSDTPVLWKTRHYPFHAIKEGHMLLCDFLAELSFDDRVGMVSYDTSHRIETTLSGTGLPYVNISSQPITNDYASVKKLMQYKQAAHYSYATNMGGGLKDAIYLLDNYKRVGSRPSILLMTDGNANTWDSGENGNLPSGWDWNQLFDYNGDGIADYTTSDSYARNVLKYVKQAVDKGYTVHAISVGADADRQLLQAIAHLGKGQWIDVPGGMSVADVQDQVKEAFRKIAAAVPPARLVKSND